MEDEALAREICDEVIKHWEETKSPVLLSVLGNKFSPRTRTIGQPLKSFIQKELTNKIAVIRHSDNATITAAMPINLKPDLQEEIDSLLSRMASVSSEDKLLRFYPVFWNAFRKPVEKGANRYITFEGDRFRIFDDKSDPTAENNRLHIAAKWMADEKQGLSDKSIYDLITSWAAENNVDLSKFAFKNIKIVKSSAGPHKPAKTLLELLLSTLSQGELERANLPLDIITRLHHKKL